MYDDCELLFEGDAATQFLGLPVTPEGLRNFRFAVRSLIEVGVIGHLLEASSADPDHIVEARRYKAIDLLIKFCQRGWHPMRVGRTLKLDHPMLSAVVLGYYLEIISNSPIKLRSVLIDIIVGKKKQTFLKPGDLVEFTETSVANRRIRRKKSETKRKASS